MPTLVVIEQQIKEKQRGAQYMVPKDPSLNRVNALFILPNSKHFISL